jgi:hypothetical protein
MLCFGREKRGEKRVDSEKLVFLLFLTTDTRDLALKRYQQARSMQLATVKMRGKSGPSDWSKVGSSILLVQVSRP